LASGHHLGLHFDCASHQDISTDNINYYILRKCHLLEQFFGHPVEAISFHRPSQPELGRLELYYPHSCESVFLEKFKYFSDSRGNWSQGNPLESEAFLRRKNLHILVHPIWWTVTPMTPYERLVSFVEGIGHRTEQYMSQNYQVWKEDKVRGKSG